MKVIQLNIWGGKLGLEVIKFLKTEQPDFVCLQEVNDLQGPSGYGFFATLDEIKTGAGMQYAYMSPRHSSRYMERELAYGNATLSNLPFTDSRTIFTHGQYKRNFDVTKYDDNSWNLQIMTIQTGKTLLHILNYHGYHIVGSKAGNDETLRHMRLIADVIDTLEGPFILCGDFNLTPDTPSIAVLDAKLTNLSTTHGLQTTCNQFTPIDGVLDYIFTNELVQAQRFEMSEAVVSDHNALILEFGLKS